MCHHAIEQNTTTNQMESGSTAITRQEREMEQKWQCFTTSSLIMVRPGRIHHMCHLQLHQWSTALPKSDGEVYKETKAKWFLLPCMCFKVNTLHLPPAWLPSQYNWLIEMVLTRRLVPEMVMEMERGQNCGRMQRNVIWLRQDWSCISFIQFGSIS